MKKSITSTIEIEKSAEIYPEILKLLKKINRKFKSLNKEVEKTAYNILNIEN